MQKAGFLCWDSNECEMVPLMIDFMSHLEESMLCKEMRSSPGVSGDMEELPSPIEQTNN